MVLYKTFTGEVLLNDRLKPSPTQVNALEDAWREHAGLDALQRKLEVAAQHRFGAVSIGCEQETTTTSGYDFRSNPCNDMGIRNWAMAQERPRPRQRPAIWPICRFCPGDEQPSPVGF